MKMRTTLAAALCAVAVSGCKSEQAPAPKAPEASSTAQEGTAASPDKKEAAKAPQAAAATTATEDVRPPKAEDLPGYIADLAGSGPLMATFDTSMGTIHCTLYEKEAPMTVANFVGLARGLKAYTDPNTNQKARKPFFDGLKFHRVIPNFMIQGGDPLGQGTGGPGYRFGDEFVPSLRHDKPGRLSMANAGPGTNGSQFFVTERPTPHLDNRHTIFGQCDEVDVVQKMARVDKAPNDPTQSKPAVDVVVNKVTISRGK
ncbi:MAG: hypothetical protein AMXMBFR64_54180 [Myxococcales bacterium]